MKKIIVTGCNGQLGRAINLAYKGEKEFELVNTDVEELDITNIEEVMHFVHEIQPYAIINCAAYTAVDKCEEEEELAFKINAIGPRNLSIAANKERAKIVHVSTDYIFKGDASNPYTEYDMANPQGAYGRTKLAGENFVREFSSNYFILRTAWLYGEGKNFVKTMLQLAETKEVVRVVNDQFGTPTSAKELARAIKHIVNSENYGVFHATCEGQTNWASFAQEIFRLAGKETKVEGISSAEYITLAKRPMYSVLDNQMFRLTNSYQFVDWKEALREYMETI